MYIYIYVDIYIGIYVHMFSVRNMIMLHIHTQSGTCDTVRDNTDTVRDKTVSIQ